MQDYIAVVLNDPIRILRKLAVSMGLSTKPIQRLNPHLSMGDQPASTVAYFLRN